MEVGREYLIKAAHVIVSNNMQVTPPHMDGVLTLEEPDDDTKEHVTTIAHFIYSDNFAQMVLAYPPFLDAEYNRQLKLLSFMQPWLAKHSIVLMRCKSLVLLREAMQLSRMRAETTAATSSGGIIEHTALSSEWHTQYWETIEEVTSHVAVLYPQMLQTSLYSDPEHALSLKVCIIIALAAQVELHRMPGTYHMESRQKALSVVLEVIGLTKSLKDDDYAMLESVLGLCFTIIANAIRNDRELLVGISQSGSREREAFNVLINSTQQLATKLPFVGKYHAHHQRSIQPSIGWQTPHWRYYATSHRAVPRGPNNFNTAFFSFFAELYHFYRMYCSEYLALVHTRATLYTCPVFSSLALWLLESSNIAILKLALA
ncbi:uncharacterized protein PHACADRAFT_125635, partial [Phanerochaete carnosa HHB-10118-sp]